MGDAHWKRRGATRRLPSKRYGEASLVLLECSQRATVYRVTLSESTSSLQASYLCLVAGIFQVRNTAAGPREKQFVRPIDNERQRYGVGNRGYGYRVPVPPPPRAMATP